MFKRFFPFLVWSAVHLFSAIGYQLNAQTAALKTLPDFYDPEPAASLAVRITDAMTEKK